MSYKIVPWSEDLDLREFYQTAKEKGFLNNSNEELLVDSFRNEREWNVWILYYNNNAVGSMAAHSFDDVMGPNTYRVAVRTCVFTDKVETSGLKTLRTMIDYTKGQHPVGYLFKACIDWVPEGSRIFTTTVTSNTSGQQEKAHTVTSALSRFKTFKKIGDIHYRHTDQTLWEILLDQ